MDIILFLKHEGSFKNMYQYEMVEKVDYPKDENIPKVTITYRNDNEKAN